jgi:hypothetical protein
MGQQCRSLFTSFILHIVKQIVYIELLFQYIGAVETVVIIFLVYNGVLSFRID